MQLETDGLQMTRLPSALALGALVVAEVATDSAGSGAYNTQQSRTCTVGIRSTRTKTSLSSMYVAPVSAVVLDGCWDIGVGSRGMDIAVLARLIHSMINHV